jgi:tRNA(Ile)-lysidine synthase
MKKSADQPTQSLQLAIANALRLLPESAHVCIAFSGGEDSTVLLHALVAEHARTGQNLVLSALHVHHGLSPNADAWAAHCTHVCAQLKVPLTVTHVTVDRNAKQGIEAAAREARYHALFDQKHTGVTHIALAHHALDQAETVLLQLLRGAGPKGLSAMAHGVMDVDLINAKLWRPLLGVRKADISAYAKQHALSFIVDESNADERFARNRLRHAVWPNLLLAFPGAETTLARAAILQAEAAVLQRDIAEIDARHYIKNDALKLAPWRTLSSERRKNLLRFWLAQHACPALSFDRLSDWDRQLVAAETNQSVCLPTPLPRASVRVYRDMAYWVRQSSHAMPVAWLGAAETAFADDVISFTLSIDESTALDHASTHMRVPRAGEKWTLRTRNEGDTIKLSPNSGHVTFKNVMQNAGVPPWIRERWPVLVCNGTVAALPGLCVNSDFAAQTNEQGGQLAWKPKESKMCLP